MVTAAMVLSQGVVAYATDGSGNEAATKKVYVDATGQDNTDNTVKSVTISDSSNDDTGVEAVSTAGHEAGVTVEGNVTVEKTSSSTPATGVEAKASDKGETTVTTGNVSAEGIDAYGVKASAESSGKTTVTTGNVSAEGDYEIYGVNANAANGGDVSVTTGSVDAKSSYGSAHGVSLSDFSSDSNSKSEVNVTVNGDVNASGKNAYGIQLYGGENIQQNVVVNGNVKAKKAEGTDTNDGIEGIQIESFGDASVKVTGNVESDLIGIVAGFGGESGNKVDVIVGGDLSAGDTAVSLSSGGADGTLNLTVDGTIEGDKHNIVINSASDEVSTEGLNVTVWKIDTSKKDGKDKATIEVKTEGKYNDYSDKAKDVINYIIKVDDTSKLKASSDKAKEGEKVYLEVNVPSGYTIDSFYTGKGGTNVDVVSDSSGKYYLVVPRGGGVYVGVSLKANSSYDSGSDSSDKSDDGNTNKGPGDKAPGNQDGLDGKVNVGQTVRVGGQEINTNVTVKATDEVTTKSFADSLSGFVQTGMLDFGGAFVTVPADAVIKESFTVSVEGLEGFVTTYFELADYKAGDVIMCSYIDANGVMVVFAVTPDMINGTSLLLTIPANCTLALAGSNA